jgi:hypothetical protein
MAEHGEDRTGAAARWHGAEGGGLTRSDRGPA